MLTYVAEDLLSFEQRELFEAITSIAGGRLRDLDDLLDAPVRPRLARTCAAGSEQAIGLGGLAVVAMAFLAVVREGLETALLFYAAAQGAATYGRPAARPLAGVADRGRARLAHLRRRHPDQPRHVLHAGPALLLILVAAGILKYGVHDLQEAGVLPGLTTYAFDISGVLRPDAAWYAALLGGMFNFTAAPTVLETIAWVGYAVPVLVLFLWPAKPRVPAVADAAAVAGTGRRRRCTGSGHVVAGVALSSTTHPSFEGDQYLCCVRRAMPSWRPA